MSSSEKTNVVTLKTKSLQWLGVFILLSILMLLASPVMADMVNINKADAEALQQNMEGIGPVKAKAIVDYRKKNGDFKSVDDLAKVPGIGKETMQKNKRNVSTTRGLVKAEASNSKSRDQQKDKTKSKTDGPEEMDTDKSKAGKKLKQSKDEKSSMDKQENKSAKELKKEQMRSKKEADKKLKQEKKIKKDKEKAAKKASKQKKTKKQKTDKN